MPRLDAERIKVAEEVRAALAIENRLSRTQARAFVRSLQTSWEVPTIQWEDIESRGQLRDARRLIHAATIFRDIEGPESVGAIDCYRRAGETLEWLTRAADTTRSIAPIELFAAAAFQLGGLPAMANGLLGQLPLDLEGTQLYAAFLRADFDIALKHAATFWGHHPQLTGRDSPQNLLADDGPGRIGWYFTVELIRALGLAADALRRGNEARLGHAMAKLDALERLASRTFSDDVSLLVSLLRATANGFRQASIYTPIEQLAALNLARRPRLRAFARGQFARGRGILWSSQQHGLARLLENSSFALCTPTGSGKTLVANLALVKELLLPNDADDGIAPLALYLVPSRALAGEVEAKLQSELGADFIVTGLYGGSDWGITDYWLQAERPTVLIATVEKADALMRYVGPILQARLRLLIVDEAHQVVPEDDAQARASFAEHSNRAIRLEAFVSRLLTQTPDIVCIALTAVAGGAAAPVAKWIEGRPEAEAIGTRYRSTRQIIGVLETTPDAPPRALLDIMNGRPLFVRGRDDAVYLRLRIPTMPQLPAQMRNSLYRFNELSLLWTALHLTDSKRRILISVAQEPEKTMRWFKEAFDLPSWGGAPAFAVSDAHRARFDEARATAVDYCGADSYEVALLDRGIATSHGQMPQRLRRLMTDLIDRGICPITVATATLTEGVNLPFDLIFVASLKRRSYDAANQQPIVAPMSTAEFRNLAGRAGRPGATKGLEGMTLVAIPRRPSTTAAGQLAIQGNQRSELVGDYNALRRALLTEGGQEQVASPLTLLLRAIASAARAQLGLQGEAFLAWLDQVAPFQISPLAGTAETDPRSQLADSVDELDGVLLTALEEVDRLSVASVSPAEAEALLRSIWQNSFSRYAAAQEAWLESAIVRRGLGLIRTVYPDPEERKRLYQYGLSPHVGRRFENAAPAILALIHAADQYGEWNDLQRLAYWAQIGALLAADRGFGFRVRNTDGDRALLARWQDLLAWWLQAPDAPVPDPQDLRAWQRFVADNLEYRLGVAVGAVVARAWANGAANPFAVPSLQEWRPTTGLPWFGFWARELLRWGTLDPFVAFALAQGLARTREEAAALRDAFDQWLVANRPGITADDAIDPQLFLEWQRSLHHAPAVAVDQNATQAAQLTGTTGAKAPYDVVPSQTEDGIFWLDAAGFALARSPAPPPWLSANPLSDDYQLDRVGDAFSIRRSYMAASAR